jgi:hypothetical protein
MPGAQYRLEEIIAEQAFTTRSVSAYADFSELSIPYVRTIYSQCAVSPWSDRRNTVA